LHVYFAFNKLVYFTYLLVLRTEVLLVQIRCNFPQGPGREVCESVWCCHLNWYYTSIRRCVCMLQGKCRTDAKIWVAL